MGCGGADSDDEDEREESSCHVFKYARRPPVLGNPSLNIHYPIAFPDSPFQYPTVRVFLTRARQLEKGEKLKGFLKAIAACAALATVLFALSGSATSGNKPRHVIQDALSGDLQPAVLPVTANGQTIQKQMPFISEGTILSAKFGGSEEADKDAAADTASGGDFGAAGDATGSGPGSLGCASRDKGKGNKRVNQDCSFRRQAEEDIAFNPLNPNQLSAGQNDSRVGFNQCGIDWSTDNGKHWGDMLPPFRQRFNSPERDGPNTVRGGLGTNKTYDFASDPTVAWDSQGRAFFSCIMIDINTDASGIFVTASPPGAAGSFYFNVPQFGRPFIAVEDNSPAAAHDKQFITTDTYASSPNRDNVYLTWTVFNFTCGASGSDYCSSEIYGSMSTDHARTWSRPELINGANAQLCQFGNFFNPAADGTACNFNQGSDPIALPNGDLEVVFNNGNTPTVDNQQLAVHCKPAGSSVAGTAHLNCANPTTVGPDVLAGAPICNFGRYCIPGHYIRTNDFPRIGVNTDNGHLYAVWQDYRNQEWDIQMSHSYDGGLTWVHDGTVNSDRGLDHYFPAVDIAEKGNGDNVGVSYYRTERVAGENTTPSSGFARGATQTCGPGGNATCMGDYVLGGGTNFLIPFDFKVMSPIFPPPDGAQAGFNGDYSGLTIPKGDEAHPIWSDTRNVDPFAPQNGVVHDEDVFTDTSGLPNGNAKCCSVGQIGKR